MGVVLPQPVQFGKYTLFERIGRGGMADVFKARVQGPAGFERVFVVKRILPHLSDDPTFTRMFIEEAKMSARLSHPNIVQVFELGSVDNEYFISLEYVRGRDLAETMRTLWARVGPPRPEVVAYIGREVCRALAYAHDLVDEEGSPIGMIHRDVSPSNVMLSHEGMVKILDFGIAKALGGEHREDGATQRGTLKGKFAYMAPEQTQGVDVDRRIDIFATGIVLHEILTGRRLFKGENDLQTMEKVRICDVPPPSLQNPLCPPELDAIVLHALAKNREDRFKTASEMAEALDDVVHAARFQPSHLAQLMRDLFPTDVAGGDATRTGSGSRVSQAMGTSGSRPVPGTISGSRSPTIPPISRSVSPARPSQNELSSLARAATHKPAWRRASTWAVAGLVVLAFAGGALWKATGTSGAGRSMKESPVRVIPLEFVIQSVPSGADVYLLGGNEFLGTTPVKKRFEWREDRPTILVFRLKGYEEHVREVKPTWTGFVTLRELGSGRPAPAPVKTATPPPAAAQAGASPPPPDESPKPVVSPPKSALKRRPPGVATGTATTKPKFKPTRRKNDLVNPF